MLAWLSLYNSCTIDRPNIETGYDMAHCLPSQSHDPEDKTDWVNMHVCRRLKTGRILKNMSQDRLAKAIGISYQQLQRYESGKSRLPCSLLYRAATALNAPVAWFFDDLLVENDSADVRDGLAGPDKQSLVAGQNIQAISSNETRLSLLRLIDDLAAPTQTRK
jgi:transcriptional regulator with XRE-family HTH domain